MTEKRLYCRVQFSAIGNNTEGKDVMKVMTMKKPERAAITVRLPQALYDKKSPLDGWEGNGNGRRKVHIDHFDTAIATGST